MILNGRAERVRGANDVLPDDCASIDEIEGKVKAYFAAYGYRPIDVPIMEHTDLYLRKSGEELISRLYDFTFQSRRLCLRPEMTASVMRAYVENLQEAPLPVRLYYTGPVFRNEKPQRGRYRQFTQMGVEVIGADSPMADAEILQLACQGLAQFGLKQHSTIIGHIGILVNFLDRLALESRVSRFLLTQMETLRKEGSQVVADRLIEIYPAFGSAGLALPAGGPAPSPAAHPKNAQNFAGSLEIIEAMNESEARAVVLSLLDGMTVKLDSTRDPDEIVNRLLAKMKRQDQSPQIKEALGFMNELGQLRGEPAAVLAEAERLLAAYEVDRSPLNHLRATIGNLGYYGVNWEHIELNLGLTRGVHHYTGLVFEIEHGSTGGERQLCGGGRYDTLITALGGRKGTPAAGFAYGLERIKHALEDERAGAEHKAGPAVDILLVPVGAQDVPDAIAAAEQLRDLGLAVEMAIRERSVAGNFRYADRRQIPFAAVVGPDERAASVVTLKDLASRTSQQLPVSDVARYIRAARSQ